MARQLYHALIKTHHITSRKKLAILKTGAKQFCCYILLRSGGVPGVMYLRGQSEAEVQSLIGMVRKLRYKDYQLISSAHPINFEMRETGVKPGILDEVNKVKDMGVIMKRLGVYDWWRAAMGFTCDLEL